MAKIGFVDQFKGVSEWARGRNVYAAFPTCAETPTSDPYIFDHGVVTLQLSDVSLGNPTAQQLGIDPSTASLRPERWRDLFTSANAYARSLGFFHAFVTFEQMDSPDGPRFGIVLIRSTGPQPGGNGIIWRDIPAEEVFPEVPAGASSFLSLSPETWMQRLDAWAASNGLGGALPTGWFANYQGQWVLGAVLFDTSAASRVRVSGIELGYDQEICGRQSKWISPPSGSANIIATSDSVAYPAPPAVDDAPFGDRLYMEPYKVDYFRCLAQRTGEARIAIFGSYPDAVRLLMRPRADERRRIFFGNGRTTGGWIVAHRFDFEAQEGVGEVVSYYRAPRQPSEEFAFELTTGTAGPGQIQAHTVGFVQQGFIGIAHPFMSFAYSTFMRLSAGMDVYFGWTTWSGEVG